MEPEKPPKEPSKDLEAHNNKLNVKKSLTLNIADKPIKADFIDH